MPRHEPDHKCSQGLPCEFDRINDLATVGAATLEHLKICDHHRAFIKATKEGTHPPSRWVSKQQQETPAVTSSSAEPPAKRARAKRVTT